METVVLHDQARRSYLPVRLSLISMRFLSAAST